MLNELFFCELRKLHTELYELGDMQKAAKEVLDVISQLKASGEIIVNFTY